MDCEHHETRPKETIKLCLSFLKKNFDRSQISSSVYQHSIGVTLVDRTESLRKLDIENLNINIMRTPPPSLETDAERPAQTTRYYE